MANATNVLANGIEITGSIKFSNDMVIDGKVDGEITSDKGKVTIGENASQFAFVIDDPCHTKTFAAHLN